MRRRLVTLAAASALALALSAAPVQAAGHGGGHGGAWVVIESDSTPVAGFPIVCGHNSYTAIQGTADFVWRQKGAMDASGIALEDGQAIETVTLTDVKVRNDTTHRVYRAVGSYRATAAWAAGADIFTGVGFTAYRQVENVRIEGTRDGRTWVVELRHGSFVTMEDRGSCSDLELLN